MPFVIQEGELKTNGTYTSLLKARIVGRVDASLVIKNEHATAQIKWKVLVSNDPHGAANSFGELKAEALLAGNAVTPYAITGTFGWIDVQIMSNGAGESPLGYCWIMAAGI